MIAFSNSLTPVRLRPWKEVGTSDRPGNRNYRNLSFPVVMRFLDSPTRSAWRLSLIRMSPERQKPPFAGFGMVRRCAGLHSPSGRVALSFRRREVLSEDGSRRYPARPCTTKGNRPCRRHICAMTGRPRASVPSGSPRGWFQPDRDAIALGSVECRWMKHTHPLPVPPALARIRPEPDYLNAATRYTHAFCGIRTRTWQSGLRLRPSVPRRSPARRTGFGARAVGERCVLPPPTVAVFEHFVSTSMCLLQKRRTVFTMESAKLFAIAASIDPGVRRGLGGSRRRGIPDYR